MKAGEGPTVQYIHYIGEMMALLRAKVDVIASFPRYQR